MKEKILEQIRKYPHTSFAELMRIEGASGDIEIGLGNNNLVLWSGVSEEFANAFESLREEKLLDVTPTTILTYMCDGALLKYPIAKRARAYKKPHWLPVTFTIRNPTSSSTSS